MKASERGPKGAQQSVGGSVGSPNRIRRRGCIRQRAADTAVQHLVVEKKGISSFAQYRSKRKKTPFNAEKLLGFFSRFIVSVLCMAKANVQFISTKSYPFCKRMSETGTHLLWPHVKSISYYSIRQQTPPRLYMWRLVE